VEKATAVIHDDDDQKGTLPLANAATTAPLLRRFHLEVTAGPSVGRTWDSIAETCSIGSHESNQLVIDDPAVSRFHCEIRVGPHALVVRDLGSRNGTIVDGVRVIEAHLRSGSVLKLGASALSFQLRADRLALPLSDRTEMGALVGASVAMRGVFALLERVAASDVTVLLEGETGSGKEVAAEAIHLHSARRDQPFIVVDCGAIPAPLLEAELFGYEKGAFTGAAARRTGAFEEAGGGTIFLDEIGELSADLQPKLLRVIERREIRPLGRNQMRGVDVRIIAATNRDLRTFVNEGRFRADLLFRLAVVRITLPTLSSRPEDIPLLVERFLARMGARPDVAAKLRAPEFVSGLQQAFWSGNVRELRNHLERCIVFEQALPVGDTEAPEAAGDMASYSEARRRVLEGFERRFLAELLAHHRGRVTDAAEAAGMDRVHLHRLMRKYGLTREHFAR
jgi:DNA-binding NtrC family response regulator